MSLIAYLSRIHFADRVLEDALPEELRRVGAARPLLIRDKCGKRGDRADRLDHALPVECNPIELPWPAEEGAVPVATPARLFSTERCDAILGVGGAAALDLARLLGKRLHAGLGVEVPVIAVPATIANVGLGPIEHGLPGAAVCRPAPSVILCDPTLLLPAADAPRIAARGMDALSHCIEAYLGTTFNPPADGIALEGIRLLTDNLERVVARPEDLEAHRDVLAAVLCAGMAAEKGLGGVEALARAVEPAAAGGASHGRFHAALLPPVLAFNAPALGARLSRIAGALGLGAARDVAPALRDLAGRMGLSTTLAEAGLAESALPGIADAAASHSANRTNPRHATAEDYLSLLRAAQ